MALGHLCAASMSESPCGLLAGGGICVTRPLHAAAHSPTDASSLLSFSSCALSRLSRCQKCSWLFTSYHAHHPLAGPREVSTSLKPMTANVQEKAQLVPPGSPECVSGGFRAAGRPWDPRKSVGWPGRVAVVSGRFWPHLGCGTCCSP